MPISPSLAMYRYVQVPSVFTLTLSLILLSPLLLAQQVCYYPDGTEATDHTPCNGSASNTPTDASSCCHDISNSYCQDNNLCTWNGAMYRGACTDKTWTSPNCPQQCTECSQSSSHPLAQSRTLTSQPAERNSITNIFPCPASGVWECERSSDCASNFTLPNFGILLRDTQLPGNKKEGIGLADPNASNTSAAAGATVTVTAGTTPSNAASTSSATVTKSKNNSDALAVGLGVGIPLGILLLGCIALLFRQQRKLKGERAAGPPLGGTYEKGQGYKNLLPGTGTAHELPEHRAVPELRDSKSSAHELGGHSMPGSPPPPPPPLSK